MLGDIGSMISPNEETKWLIVDPFNKGPLLKAKKPLPKEEHTCIGGADDKNSNSHKKREYAFYLSDDKSIVASGSHILLCDPSG